MLKKLKKKLGLEWSDSVSAAENQTASVGEGRPNIPEVAVREIKRMLFEAFANHPSRIYDSKMAAKQIGIQGNDGRKMIHDLMRQMAVEGVLEKVGAGQYRLVRKQLPTRTGKVDMTASGMVYIIVDDAAEGEKDIIVEPRHTHHAMHGDHVRVAIIGRRRDGRIEGEVVETLEQGKRTFVGRIEISDKYAFVIIDSRTMPADIFVPLRSVNGAQNGQKVIVRITEWPEAAKNQEYAIFPGLNWIKGIISPHYGLRALDFDEIISYNNKDAIGLEDNSAIEIVNGEIVRSISCGGSAYRIHGGGGRVSKEIIRPQLVL